MTSCAYLVSYHFVFHPTPASCFFPSHFHLLFSCAGRVAQVGGPSHAANARRVYLTLVFFLHILNVRAARMAQGGSLTREPPCPHQPRSKHMQGSPDPCSLRACLQFWCSACGVSARAHAHAAACRAAGVAALNPIFFVPPQPCLLRILPPFVLIHCCSALGGSGWPHAQAPAAPPPATAMQ